MSTSIASLEQRLVPAEPRRSSCPDMQLYRLVENLMELQAPKARWGFVEVCLCVQSVSRNISTSIVMILPMYLVDRPLLCRARIKQLYA